MISIKDTVGSDYQTNLEDVYKVKTALKKLGYYQVPVYGMTPYPDEALYTAIKNFQKENKLKTDGVVRPQSTTLASLVKALGGGDEEGDEGDDPDVRSPSIKCPVCGGWHGGVAGDLCPDCASK
jgi:peptidoglycan hydrolase-like protein with peptidoglycan-binding domain